MKYAVGLRMFLMTLLPLALAQPPALTTAQDDVIRIETNLVIVPVTVKTRGGAFIPNLEIKDFQIYEDGIRQEISQFETVDKPFTVTLMLDLSDSTKADLQEIQDAALAFIGELHADDRAIIVGFDKRIARMNEPTSDRQVLAQTVRSVKTGGGTALYDALTRVISSNQRRTPERKAIVVLTDGIDTSSINSTSESTLALAAQEYALIYPIQYDSLKQIAAKQLSDSRYPPVTYTTPGGEPVNKAYERGTRYLRGLARTSGGRFHYAGNVKNLRRAFAAIAEELRQQYSLSYSPKNQATTKTKRRIKVEVSVPDAVVHARESYSYKPKAN
jgi:Ca-activated chloride channel family protein